MTMAKIKRAKRREILGEFSKMLTVSLCLHCLWKELWF